MIALLLACAGAPQDALTWREGMEFLAVLDGQGILDARITTGNTGFLRGQTRMRVDRWSAEGDPILFSQHAAPEQPSRVLQPSCSTSGSASGSTPTAAGRCAGPASTAVQCLSMT